MTVRVSIEALERLAQSSARFEEMVRNALQSAERELQTVEGILFRRLQYWEGEVLSCRQRLESARAALSACQASGMYDPETGVHFPPNCSSEENAVYQAEAALGEAEREKANVELWIDTVRREAEAYRGQSVALSRTVSHVVPSGREFLRSRVAHLQEFARGRG